MGRFRNPRYAPEFLERKLSPSFTVANPVSAIYSVNTDTTADGGEPTTAPPSPGNGTTPIVLPSNTSSPSLPA